MKTLPVILLILLVAGCSGDKSKESPPPVAAPNPLRMRVIPLWNADRAGKFITDCVRAGTATTTGEDQDTGDLASTCADAAMTLYSIYVPAHFQESGGRWVPDDGSPTTLAAFQVK